MFVVGLQKEIKGIIKDRLISVKTHLPLGGTFLIKVIFQMTRKAK